MLNDEILVTTLTFIFSKFVSLVTKDGSKSQFDALFLVLDETGFVLHYAFTRSQSLDEFGSLLQSLSQLQNLITVYTGKTFLLGST